MESNAFQPLLNIDMNWFYLWSLNEKHLKWEISSSRSIKQELFKKLHICIFFIWKSFASQGSTFCQRLSWLYIWFCFYVYGFTLLHLCIFLAWIFNLKLRRLVKSYADDDLFSFIQVPKYHETIFTSGRWCCCHVWLDIRSFVFECQAVDG